MQEFLETFHIDWHTMVAQLINFGLVFLALYVLAAKPLRKMIEERSSEIAEGLDNAKKNKEMLSKTEIEYDKALTKARHEAEGIWKQAKADGEKIRAEMLENTKKEVSRMLEDGKKNLEIEKNKMVMDAKNEVAKLVLEATEKVLAEKK